MLHHLLFLLKPRPQRKHMAALLVCIGYVLMSVPLLAAQTVYLKPVISHRPIWSDSSIEIDFEIEEELCRKAYGKKWKSSCSVDLGSNRQRVTDIVAEGWPMGTWTWTNSNSLKFEPEKSWKSDTYYQADIANVQLPSRVQLSSKTVGFNSLPLSANIQETRVWIDPSPKSEHAISFSMRFTESLPAAERQRLQNVAAPQVKKNSGFTLSKAKWIWLNDNTRAVVNARILTMPQQDTVATLTLPNVRPLWKEDDTWYFPDKNSVTELVIPGSNSTFTLKDVEIETVQNKALHMEQHLIFNFSQRTKPEEFLKALTVLELPLQRSKENIVDSQWKQGGISPENRKQARPVQVEVATLPSDSADVLRFRVNATPGHYILWNVAAGFGPTNAQGIHNPLKRALEGVEFIPTNEPRLELLQAGNVLMPQSNIAVMSEHLDSIRWSAHRFLDTSLAVPYLHSLDETMPSSLLDANTTAIHGEIQMDKAVSATKNAPQEKFTHKPTYSKLTPQEVFGTAKGDVKPGLVYLSLSGIKNGKEVVSMGRVLMYSDMGLVIKEQADKSMQVFISSLKNAKAMDDVTVQVLGKNGLPVAEASTNKAGKATFSKLSHLSGEKKPVAVVARYESWGDEDMLWMSLLDYQLHVNTSRFADMEGKQSSVKTLNAFVFSERGLFRPGEDMNFGVLLRTNDWKLLPANMPLLATLQDSTDRTVFSKTFMAGEGIHSITWPIPEAAQTGNYSFRVFIPAQDTSEVIPLGYKEVKVANFIPDTLQIKTELVSATKGATPKLFTKGWLVTSPKEEKSSLHVQLRTLFGQAAMGRRVEAEMRLDKADLTFPGYEKFTFQDISPFFTNSTDTIYRELGETTTDAEGKAVLPLDFSQWRFGTLQCVLVTEGFEPGGGRSVSQYDSFLLSPLPFMLGYKTGEGVDNKNFILKDSASQMDFQVIDSKLKPTHPGNLTFTIARRQMVSTLVTDKDGEYTYNTTPLDTVVSQTDVQFSAEGALQWNIPTQEVGDYLLTVKIGKNTAPAQETANTLAEGTVLANVTFSVVGNDDLRPALKLADELPEAKLTVKADKKEYNGGEKAKLMIKTPYDSVALITLERDSVVAHKWVKLTTGNNLHELPIPSDFTGRGYIQVLMGRAPQSEHIFLQPQSVAMVAVNVNTALRSTDVKITAAEKTIPGVPLQWRIENNKGKATKAILFAVDEGILQLSKFKTPDPLHYLLLDRALEVSTSQLFERVMPEYAHIMKRLSAFGGDGDVDNPFAGLLGTFQNPFKRKLEPPVVWWSGVVDIPANGLDVEVPIPSYYNGSVRLMAVLQNAETVGSADARVIVQGEQVLTPQVPAMAALGDSFEAGLGITNTTDEALTLSLALDLDAEQSTASDIELFALPQSVKIGPKDEKFLPFKVKVGQVPGNAVLRFTAENGQGKKTVRTTSFSVRPAVLPRYSQQTLELKQSAAIQTQRNLLPYGAQTSLTVSTTPLPLLRSSLSYLENNKYNGLEQSLSKAFPLVALHGSPLNSVLEKNRMLPTQEMKEKTLEKAYNALISSYDSYYGINYWANRYEYDSLITAYAGDYVLALRDAGLPVPPGILPDLFQTLERHIDSSPSDLEELRAMAYTAWILARAGYVVSKPLELCEAYIKEYNIEQSDIFHTLMAGAYAAMYMLPEAEAHLTHVNGEALGTWQSTTHMLDLLSQYGLHLRVLAKHFPAKFKEAVPHVQALFLEGLNKPHATLAASMTALGLASILQNAPANTQEQGSGMELSCLSYDTKPSKDPVPHILSGVTVLDAAQCTSFEVRVPQNTTAFAQVESYGYDKDLPQKDFVQKLQVKKNLSFEDGTPVEGSVKQGDVITVDIIVSPYIEDETYIVVTDLLPGGFELVQNHPDDTESYSKVRINKQEDRVVAFVTVTGEHAFTYHILATNKGQYTLPSTLAESVGDRSLQSHTATRKLQIIAP